MDIKFIDPGYGENFTLYSSTGEISYVENDTYNPVNGVAFTANSEPYETRLTKSNNFGSESVGVGYGRMLSVRFSVYFTESFVSGAIPFTLSFFPGNYPTSTARHTLSLGYEGFIIHSNFMPSSGGSQTTTSKTLFTASPAVGTVYDCSLSASALLLSKDYLQQCAYAEVNGVTISTIQNANRGSTTFTPNSSLGTANISFKISGGAYISNLVIAYSSSDRSTKLAPLRLRSSDIPVRLPLSTPPVTDFTTGEDGEYIGTRTGQKLLQTVNTTDLVTKFGTTNTIKQLVIYGNPGYRVGSNITTATGISQYGSDSIITHGSCALGTVANNDSAVAWETESGTTLSDIDGLKVGWQV